MPFRLLFGLFLSLVTLLAACDDEPAGPDPDPGPEDDGSEITIQYVERLPRIDYVPDSPSPDREGWPAPGQEVRWRAHLRNWASHPRTVEYAWELDGSVVDEGEVELPAGGEATADYPWAWTFDRHRLAFVLDRRDLVPEEEEENNRLEVFTDALSLGLWVEEGFYRFMREHQGRIQGAHSTSFEDFAHRHVRRFNEMAREAIYPETPQGVLDRIRLDRVVVVPDGSLEGRNFGDRDDRSLDLQWVFQTSEIDFFRGLGWTETGPLSPEAAGASFYNGSALHEIGHARYLVDVYALRVAHDFLGHRVEITEGGEPVVGTALMPYEITDPDSTRGIAYRTSVQGLMNTDYSFIDRYSAVALNLIAGHRPVAGNFNAPQNLGEFLWDVPAETRLHLTDEEGRALSGAELRVYQGEIHPPGQGEGPYPALFDGEADVALQADDQGVVTFTGHPFTDRSYPDRIHPQQFKAIVRVEHDGKVGYEFLEIFQLTMEYWRGNTEVADLDLEVDLQPLPAG